MRLLSIDPVKSEEIEVVLVLQGEQAYWFKYRQDHMVDSFVDYISGDAASHVTRCPWLLATPELDQSVVTVHLVLDTLLDELDHVTLDTSDRNFLGDIKRYLSIRRLRRDYAQATVYPLPKHSCTQVASLLHHIIPDSWSHWLVELQKQAVCISSVATATELLTSWSQETDSALLLNMSVGSERRHLVVDRGKPLFLRVVPASDHQDGPAKVTRTDPEVDETFLQFNHSRSSVGVKLPVVELSTDAPSPSVEWRDARTLSALRLGADLSVRQSGLKEANQECDGSANGSLPGIKVSIDKKRAGRFLPSISRLLPSRTNRESQWNPLRYAWSTMDALAETHRLLKLQARLNRLHAATLGFAFFGGLLIVTALIQGVSSADYRQMQGEQQQSNAIKTEEKIKEAQSIHPSSDAVARSIRLLDDVRSSKVVRPGAVTATIARALSKAPEVVLDRLIWTATDDSESIEGLFASIDRAMVRSQLPGAAGVPERVRVEITGVVSGHDLSARKHSLDEFIRALQENNVVSHIVVVESPVDSALNSQLVVEQSSHYRVSMIISTS